MLETWRSQALEACGFLPE